MTTTATATASPPLRCAVYVRVSTQDQLRGTSLDVQLQRCRAFAEAAGWPISGEYIEEGVSGADDRRPALDRLRTAAAAGQLDVITVFDMSRLGRNTRNLLNLTNELEQAGVATAFVQERIDTTTNGGRLFRTLLAAIAEFERDETRRRTSSGREARAKEGRLPPGGRRCFGYRQVGKRERARLVVVPQEAAIIREMYQAVMLGQSLRSIAKELTQRGIRTPGTKANPAGSVWRASTIRQLLLSPRIAGIRQFQGAEIGPGNWEPILSEAEHGAVVRFLEDDDRKPSTRRSYLLSAIARCGICGSGMIARPNPSIRRYGCDRERGCGRVFISADPLEALVVERMFAAFDDPRLTERLRAKRSNDSTRAPLVKELKEADQRLDDLVKARFVQGVVTHKVFLKARRDLEGIITRARGDLATAARAERLADLPVGGKALRSAWAEGDLMWKRAVLDAIVEGVVVSPATRGVRFDPDRVRVEWKA